MLKKKQKSNLHKQSIAVNSKLEQKPRDKTFCTTSQIISKRINGNSWKFQNHSKLLEFFKCRGFVNCLTNSQLNKFTTYQISLGSSTFHSPLAQSKPRLSTGPWSVSKRDCVPFGSKHLRAGVCHHSRSFSLLHGTWWLQWWKSKIATARITELPQEGQRL